MLEVVGDRHENLVKTCSFRIIGAGDNHQCKAGGMLASWKNSSDPGAPEENHVDPEKQEETDLVVIEYVKGAIVSLKVLEDANSCFAEPTLWLLRITLEYQRKSAKRRRGSVSTFKGNSSLILR